MPLKAWAPKRPETIRNDLPKIPGDSYGTKTTSDRGVLLARSPIPKAVLFLEPFVESLSYAAPKRRQNASSPPDPGRRLGPARGRPTQPTHGDSVRCASADRIRLPAKIGATCRSFGGARSKGTAMAATDGSEETAMAAVASDGTKAMKLWPLDLSRLFAYCTDA